MNATHAAFLITRPPIAYLGWGWESDDSKWPCDKGTGYEPFLLQPGTPVGQCKRDGSSAGHLGSAGGSIWTREWTNGKVTLDCAQWSSELPFPSL